uniref:Uncharacterized protein n=1 Tax=Romanomermis culicivorax TaxID=13658 RepID=A0A915KFN2_ROMCU
MYRNEIDADSRQIPELYFLQFLADNIDSLALTRAIARDVKDAAKWKHCALSQQPLQQPIVTCPLGRASYVISTEKTRRGLKFIFVDLSTNWFR